MTSVLRITTTSVRARRDSEQRLGGGLRNWSTPHQYHFTPDQASPGEMVAGYAAIRSDAPMTPNLHRTTALVAARGGTYWTADAVASE